MKQHMRPPDRLSCVNILRYPPGQLFSSRIRECRDNYWNTTAASHTSLKSSQPDELKPRTNSLKEIYSKTLKLKL